MGPCLVSITLRLFTGCPVIEMRAMFDLEGFNEARKKKATSGKEKELMSIIYVLTSNKRL